MSKVLGYVTCQSGGTRASIQQTNRKGKHFLTRCDCCGFNQGTGKARQQYIWDNAEWLDEVPEAPTNVDPTKKTVKSEPKQPKQEAEDFNPETDLDPYEATEEEPKKGKKWGWFLVAVPVVAGLAAVFKA